MRAAFVLVLVAAACGSRDADPPARVTPPVRPPKPEATSTIAAADYIGPDKCGECHADQHAAWSKSWHRVMNAQADATAVIGDFRGVTLAYAGGEVTFGAGPTMTVAKNGRTIRYRVTRTIGKRALQEYVGVEEGGDGTEVRLPFAWWPALGGWYPQPYFDPWLAEEAFDAYAPVRDPWAERCPWCHSTYPFAQRIARASSRPVGHGFEQHFESAPGTDTLDVAQQVTVGISCESCHLGGRAHADGAPIHLVPIGATAREGAPVPTTFAAERGDARIVNTTCAQCHSGPSPRLADGTALRNSSEALDLAASSCTTARCVDCHDPHRGGVDETRAIAACTGCHAAVASAGRAHSGHDGATCLDCHMPRVVMGIDRFVRTHRISSPTDVRVLATAGPNACNLCHLDRSIAWTVDELAREHDVRLDPSTWTAYRDVELPVGDVWLASDEPALRLIAAAAYARVPALAPFALEALTAPGRGIDDPLAHVRAYTLLSLEQILGRRPAYDPRAPVDVRRRQLRALRR